MSATGHNAARRDYAARSDASLMASDPDCSMALRTFEQIASMVGEHTGIQLPAAKKQMVEGRLRKRARALGFRDVESYSRHLLEGGGFADEFQHVVDAITTNKTDFYREPDHFDYLINRVVPEILGKRGVSGTMVKIWSAACSTGAEPYTLAMVLADLAALRNFRFAILGTDICTEVIEIAKRAIYSEETVQPIPADQQRRYLLRARTSKHAAEYRIVPELRHVVRLEHMNLMDEDYPVDRDVDVIFLRNVLIYFDKPTQNAVLRRLLKHLRPGGYLFLGHSESMVASELGLRETGAAIFQRC